MAGLAKLPAAFSKDGMVTAGNASGIVDGGAALILASEGAGSHDDLSRLRGSSCGGGRRRRSGLHGRGTGSLRLQGSEIAGLTLDLIDLIEANEAFAGQHPRGRKGARPDRNKTNVNGGAIALGHPLGMTGTRLLLTLTHELGRRQKKYGLATACIGGGQGIAAIVERL